MNDLKLCPCCKSKAELINRTTVADTLKGELYPEFVIVCTNNNCGLTLSFKTPEEAIAAWNRRTG